MIQEHHIDAAKTLADSISVSAAVLWLLHELGLFGVHVVPPLASLASFIYICLRIYETPTMQKLFGKDASPTKDDDAPADRE